MIRFDIIIYCAVAIEVAALFISLALICRHEINKKKRRRRDGTKINESDKAPNGNSYAASEDKDTNGQSTEADSEEKVVDNGLFQIR